MWRNPQLLYKSFARILVEFIKPGGYVDLCDLPDDTPFKRATPADNWLFADLSELNRLRRLFNQTDADVALMRTFIRRVVSSALAKIIEINDLPSVINGLMDARRMYAYFHDLSGWGEVGELIEQCVILACGDEQKVLIGLRNNEPVWRHLTQPIANEDEVIRLYAASDDRDLLVIDRDLSEMVPQHTKRILARQMHVNLSVRPSYENIGSLLEDAYNNQQYTIDPLGVEVLLPNCELADSVVLRVAPSIFDQNSVDFMSLFRVKDKELFLSMPAGLAFEMKEAKNRLGEIEENSDVEMAYYFLIAQIYHDLVTSKEITVMSEKKRGTYRERELREKTSGYIYIPRTVRHVKSMIRQPLEKPRASSEPHRVTGHRRHVHMTEKHRQEIIKFEEETGISVLSWLPEGYTFVRPHISPAISADELATMPKFIRLRIQQALQRSLQDAAPTD